VKKTKNSFEIREMHFKAEVRASQENDEKIIEGIIPYEKNSNDMGFIEIIKPGAFTKTIKEGDVRALWNHDSKSILARQKTGGLVLEDREDGLHFTIKIPESRAFAMDAYDVVKTGDADGVSFGFRTIKDTWIDEEGEPLKRELNEVELFEVSVGVTFPAYSGSKASTRALNDYTGLDVTGLAAIMIRSKTDGITEKEKNHLGEVIETIRAVINGGTTLEPGETHSREEQAKTTLKAVNSDNYAKQFIDY
jgi:HK97 family phage prohead protease